MSQKSINIARVRRKDEFYTQYDTIAKEIKYYDLRGKTVYCNCDGPESNFLKFFKDNFENIGLKRLIATGLSDSYNGFVYDSSDSTLTQLSGTGDFASEECTALLDQCDVVITNPPFSKFIPYIQFIIDHNKDFLLIGNILTLTNKNICLGIVKGNIKLGVSIHSGATEFRVPDDYPLFGVNNRIKDGKKYISITGVRWFTSLKNEFEPDELVLNKKYSPQDYPVFDNYDAINIDKVKDIPYDYYGKMGVPITFIDKFCKSQFEIIDVICHYPIIEDKAKYRGKYCTAVNNVHKFRRIIIKRIKQ